MVDKCARKLLEVKASVARTEADLTNFSDPGVVYARVEDDEYEYAMWYGPPVADKPLQCC